MSEQEIQAIVAAAVKAALAPAQEDQPVVESKPTREARKAANQKLNRQINAQLANATKAAKAGDGAGVVKALVKADALCPTHWDSTDKRIKAKAQAFVDAGVVTAK